MSKDDEEQRKAKRLKRHFDNAYIEGHQKKLAAGERVITAYVQSGHPDRISDNFLQTYLKGLGATITDKIAHNDGIHNQYRVKIQRKFFEEISENDCQDIMIDRKKFRSPATITHAAEIPHPAGRKFLCH